MWPLLETRCLSCHGANAKVKGGLRLTARAAILKGGESGPAVFLDAPEKSLLLDVLIQEGRVKMPPDGKLPQAQIDVLTRWMKMGLPWTPSERTPEVRRPDPACRR